jgi:hypothetical protein
MFPFATIQGCTSVVTQPQYCFFALQFDENSVSTSTQKMFNNKYNKNALSHISRDVEKTMCHCVQVLHESIWNGAGCQPDISCLEKGCLWALQQNLMEVEEWPQTLADADPTDAYRVQQRPGMVKQIKKLLDQVVTLVCDLHLTRLPVASTV